VLSASPPLHLYLSTFPPLPLYLYLSTSTSLPFHLYLSNSLPLYLSTALLLCKTGIDAMEKAKSYAECVPLLRLVLATPFLQHRRGRIFNRHDSAPHPQPSTPNPQPSTLNLQPSTLTLHLLP